MSFWIDGPAETDEQRIEVWRQQFPFVVSEVFATRAPGFDGDYSLASLGALEELILAQLPDQNSMMDRAALPFVKAAMGYLGETLRRAGSGGWVWGTGKLAGMPCVAFGIEGLPPLAPLQRVIEAVQIRDGQQFVRLRSDIDAAKSAHRTSDASDRLTALVVEIVQNHGYTCTFTADDQLELAGNGKTDWVLNLANLRRTVDQEPPDQWPAMITDHLSTLLAGIDLEAEAPLEFDDFDRMRSLIRTRMYPENMQDAGYPIVSRTLAPGLVQRVVLDQVNTIIPVTYDQLSHWPIAESALFELAEANTRGDGLVEVTDLANDSEENIVGLYLPDYASAHVRWLDAYPVAGQWGSAFIVPCEGSVYIHPLNGADAYVTVGTLAKLAVTAHAERPSPVSSSVYWWHDGAIDLAAAVIQSLEALELYVSPEFQKVMEDIAEKADGA
ncbi:hypothetical protein [Nocardia sp. NPDC049149]|uniref:hypothetical protein n=1 Tax=Nocardia sp. NPDC049149 TaxID=3364315 RepID=UPI00371C875C